MDVARFGPYASNDRYLRATTAQFYARRFVMAYPNEELPAGRPLKTTPCYDELLAAGARFTVNWGLEVPLYFAPSPDFEENATLGRSNADRDRGRGGRGRPHGGGRVRDRAVRALRGERARCRGVARPAARVPRCRPSGRIRLAPMLNEAGRLMGDLTVARLDDDRFWLTGSYYLQEWHLRWFRSQLPGDGVDAREHHRLVHGLLGLGAGVARDPRRARTTTTSRTRRSRFLGVREHGRRAPRRAVVGRISLTGELGYEIVVPANRHRTLLHELREAGTMRGLRLIGDRAIDSLRLEKGYGIWSAEFTSGRTRPR